MHFFNEIFGDEVYVINVAKDTDRLSTFTKNADEHGLKFKRFDAVSPPKMVDEGWFGEKLINCELPNVKAFVNRTCCARSHMLCAKNAKHPCLIMEDDVKINVTDDDLRLYYKYLPQDGNFILFGSGTERGTKERVNAYWTKIGNAFYGLWCYGIMTPSAADEYCSILSNVFGRSPDTAMRNMDFAMPGSPIVCYRANMRLATHNPNKYKSNCVLRTHEGTVRYDLRGYKAE